MTVRVSTARLFADKAQEKSCGVECVEWAISMLESGHDGHHLEMLAGLSPPYNHFEVADLRDRSFQEQGIEAIEGDRAFSIYAAEEIAGFLAGTREVLDMLATVRDLWIANNHLRDIYDFYLLYFAYSNLRDGEEQWYWEGANSENILEIIRDRAQVFLRTSVAYDESSAESASRDSLNQQGSV